MRVLLDLYGVLLDSERMFRGYREEVARLLSSRYGGDRDAWLRAHDEAFVSYVRHVNDADWDAGRWIEIIDRLDADNILEMFDRVGAANHPADPLVLARELEFEGMSRVDARFPDARAAIERVRGSGHKVYVATGASETNARGALTGATLIGLIDGIFSEHSQNAVKARRRYWAPIPTALGVRPDECVLVDDRLDYLDAAASVGILGLLLDRKGLHRTDSIPQSVQATLRSLAGLPQWLDTWESGKRR